MAKFLNYSEALIDVENFFHANAGSNVYSNKGDIFGPILDYQARIDSLPLTFDLNTLQTTVQITVYDANTLPYYFEYIDKEAGLNNNSLNLQGRGILSSELEFSLDSTTFLPSNKYIFKTLDFRQFQWASRPTSLFYDNFVAEITSQPASFNITSSIYAQTGFPRFTEVQLVNLYGDPLPSYRQYWIH